MQYVVEPVVLPRTLYEHDVVRLLQNADRGSIAVGVAADWAQVTFRDVVALRAELDLLAHVRHGIRELLSFVAVHSEQVKRNPLGGLGANAWQTLEFVYQPGHRFGEIGIHTRG